jgi:hypothetical protein
MRAWTLSACFAHFGAPRAARHFTGSAVSSDGTTVVVALWDDQIRRENDRVLCQAPCASIQNNKSKGVSKQWIANLKWACDHNSVIRVVVMKDAEARHKRMISCYPDDDLALHINHLDTRTGAFDAESGIPIVDQSLQEGSPETRDQALGAMEKRRHPLAAVPDSE